MWHGQYLARKRNNPRRKVDDQGMDLSGLGRSSGLTRQGVRSDRAVGLITSLAGLGASSLVLAMLAQPDGLSGTIALIAVNAAVGALRFFALRWWFTDGRAPDRDRRRVLLRGVQSVKSMLVSAPPRISTWRRSLPLESSTQ